MLQKLRLFLKEAVQELKRVNWPSRQETVRLTFIVIGASLLTAAFLGVLDLVFSYAIRNLLSI